MSLGLTGLGLGIGAARFIPGQLLQAPTDFTDAAWGKSGVGTGSAPVVTANATTAPDGTMTADKIVFDRGAGNTVGDYSILIQSNISTIAGNYLGNVYLKAVAGSVGKELGLRHVSIGSYGTPITLTADWVRYTKEEASAGGLKSFDLVTRGTITADNTVSVYVWGANLVAGTIEYPVIT